MKNNIILLFLFLSSSAYAQHKIDGQVLDDQTMMPLAGIVVSAQDMEHSSVITDLDGRFELDVPTVAALIIASGKKYEVAKKEVKLPLNEPLKILMISKILQMEELQLTTGYQKIPRERVTGSFSVVGKELLSKQVTTNIMERIDAIANGVSVTRGIDGLPQLSVRGLSTIRGPKDPLIILDDFPYEGDLGTISPDIVDQITILKDAAAASIWGAKSANGVIVITTKKGNPGQGISGDFHVSTTISSKPDLHYIQQMKSTDFIDVEKKLFSNGYYDSDISSPSHPVLTPVVDLLNKARQGLMTTDEANDRINQLRMVDSRDQFQQYMYQRMENHEYALNLYGGGKIMNWVSTLRYDDQIGNLGQQNKRINFRLNHHWKAHEKVAITLGAYYSRTDQKSGKSGYGTISMNGNWRVPYLQLADDKGNPLMMPNSYNQAYKESLMGSGLADWNFYPLTDWEHNIAESRNTELILNGGIQYKIIRGLDAEVKYQYHEKHDDFEKLADPFSYYARNYVNNFSQKNTDGSYRFIVPKGGILDTDYWKTSIKNIRGQINYNGRWKMHHIALIAGAETRETQKEGESNRYYGYNSYNTSSGAVDYTTLYPSLMTGGKDYIERGQRKRSQNQRFASLYSNASYTYDDRYIVSGSVRRDGSNLFGLKTNDQWNPFWSVGMAWNVSNERFFNQSWVDHLKMRGSYGFNGNIDPSMVAATTIIYDSSLSIYTGTEMARIDQFYNPSLRWETSAITNIGLDFSFFKGRISGSAEWFMKHGTNLFGNAPLDYTTGITSMLMNVAESKGRGLDIQMNTQNIKAGRFSWNTLINFSQYRDEIVDYYSTNKFASGYVGLSGQSVPISAVPGLPVYSIFAYRWAGLDPQTGDPQGYLDGNISKDYTKITGSEKGLEDLQYFGSALPTTFGSVINTFTYGPIRLDVGLTYKLGYWFRRSSISYNNLINNRSGHSDYSYRWQNPGDELTTQVPSNNYTINSSRDLFYLGSEILVEKGDHLRLQYITLSYEPQTSLMKIPLKSIQLYGSVSNIGVIWRANKHNLDPDYAFSNETLKPVVTYSFGLRAQF